MHLREWRSESGFDGITVEGPGLGGIGVDATAES